MKLAMLKEIREKGRLSQSELAFKAILSLSTISRLETGGSCSKGTAIRIAHVLKVKVGELQGASSLQDGEEK